MSIHRGYIAKFGFEKSLSRQKSCVNWPANFRFWALWPSALTVNKNLNHVKTMAMSESWVFENFWVRSL